MNAFTKNAVEIIQSIPEGKVMTYGQIAALAGSPRGARQVVRILHSMSRKYKLCWHRVVSAQGKISIKDEEGYRLQIMLLQDEGVVVTNDGYVDLQQYGA
ncbi:MGMT family protein [Paenibacillus sp. J2TS4]|uniref:MGMT family protein n=1 Tax=Paenibacillus sp. J2TS4 TaxID=2807194 RepID=UPI001B1F5D2C|nr:MGMT family protein [Paenibacillus sp. J2TS4]GIP32020.1 hypothetical protein J2TS4_12300 [Paenibacillus sp. J2TS4]